MSFLTELASIFDRTGMSFIVIVFLGVFIWYGSKEVWLVFKNFLDRSLISFDRLSNCVEKIEKSNNDISSKLDHLSHQRPLNYHDYGSDNIGEKETRILIHSIPKHEEKKDELDVADK